MAFVNVERLFGLNSVVQIPVASVVPIEKSSAVVRLWLVNIGAREL